MRPFMAGFLMMLGLLGCRESEAPVGVDDQPSVETPDPDEVFLTLEEEEAPFRFVDVTKRVGLAEHLSGIHGHGAGWGDLDGDGYPELIVGTFDQNGDHPNLLFGNSSTGQFRKLAAGPHAVSGRANTMLAADFDNDGDLDVYISNLGGSKEGYGSVDSLRLRNDGGPNHLEDVSRISRACPRGFRGRGASVLDFDGDGLLDLVLGEAIDYGSPRKSRLLRNRGNLRFEDVTDSVGFPHPMTGLGTAVGDVNGDGWPDVFLSGRSGGNRLMINAPSKNGQREFVEHPQSRDLFDWEYSDDDDTPAGVCFADLNNDRKMDIVVGQHYDAPWREPVQVRVFLNRGNRYVSRRSNVPDPDTESAFPLFSDITTKSGMVPLSIKAPHVDVQDMDNDGIVDICTSVVRFKDHRVVPVVFRGVGIDRLGYPRFEVTGQDLNDFPTSEDRSITKSAEFFEKVLKDRKIIYTSPGPIADFDRDGRLDLFLPNWFVESPSMLLRNVTRRQNWIEVAIEGSNGVNRMGIGCSVSLYSSGKVGQPRHLIGHREVAVGFGYASGQEAIVHFGLGSLSQCDIVVTLPHGKGEIVRQQIQCNQRLSIQATPDDLE